MRDATIAGHRLRVADAQPTFWAKVASGHWEPETLATIRAQLTCDDERRPLFLDIGAWVGATSLFAAVEGAQVIALEADPAALDQLQANLDTNPELAEKIAVIPKAIAPQAGDLRMGARRKPGDSMSSLLLAEVSERSWDVASITPAQLVAHLPHQTDVLIKLDIEGGEYALLPAMGPLLAYASRGLILSFHPRVLRERHGGDTETFRGETLAALDALDGWKGYALKPSGPIPDAVSRDVIEAVLLSDIATETWLFQRG